MFLIVGLLELAASVGLINGRPHGIGDGVCIHDHMTLSISCCTANRLDQGSFRTKEAFPYLHPEWLPA